jgi:hypothetical protein
MYSRYAACINIDEVCIYMTCMHSYTGAGGEESEAGKRRGWCGEGEAGEDGGWFVLVGETD